MIDEAYIAKVLRSAIDDAYRLGLGVAINTITHYRCRSFDTDSFDQAINDLRQQSARAEKS